MSEVNRTYESWRSPRRLRNALKLGACGLFLAGAVGPFSFTHQSTTTEIAASEVTISPALDSTVYVNSGPIAEMRMPIDSLIGAKIDIGTTTVEATGMVGDIVDTLAATYGGIAVNPDAELQKATDVIKTQAEIALLTAGGAALLPTAGFLLIGSRRRQELAELMHRNHASAIGGLALCLTAVVGAVQTASMPAPATADWVPIQTIIPTVSLPPELNAVEVKANAMTAVTRGLVEGAVETYDKAKPFYEDLEVSASNVEFREPELGEKVALVLSDRHDNTNMDPVLRATADASGAAMVFTLGDDTSAGKEWEAFSLRSLNEEFKDMTRFAVGGNHDNGPFVIKTLEELGFVTPNGELQTIEGITIAAANDPRKSDYTPEKSEGEIPYSQATTELGDLACSQEGGVNLVLAHSASMGQEALEHGCADLVIGGHTHVYAKPEPTVGENARIGYSVTNGTSGGAVFSFALGTSLRREAGALVVTFDQDGSPVGVQPVHYLPNGLVYASEFIPLSLLASESGEGASLDEGRQPAHKGAGAISQQQRP